MMRNLHVWQEHVHSLLEVQQFLFGVIDGRMDEMDQRKGRVVFLGQGVSEGGKWRFVGIESDGAYYAARMPVLDRNRICQRSDNQHGPTRIAIEIFCLRAGYETFPSCFPMSSHDNQVNVFSFC